jgi:hypothetical protein
MDKFVEVYTASDISFAYLMKENLEAAGITLQIDNENQKNVYCVDGMIPRVLVPETQVEQAKQVLAEIQQGSADAEDADEEEDQ